MIHNRENTGKFWTVSDDQLLHLLLEQELEIPDIANRLGRTITAVLSRLEKQQLVVQLKGGWYRVYCDPLITYQQAMHFDSQAKNQQLKEKQHG